MSEIILKTPSFFAAFLQFDVQSGAIEKNLSRVREGLAEEYGHILVAYMREDGFFLELEMLQRGLMWGLGRLAQARASLLLERKAATYLLPYLQSPDAVVRGLAAWTLGLLHEKKAVPGLEHLLPDSAQVRHYLNRTFVDKTVGRLAEKALANIKKEA